MAEARLRPWRLEDAADVAVMIEDEHLRHWSAMGADLEGWIRREVAEERGPSRVICLSDDDRALGRVAVRPPEFASGAVSCDAIHASDLPAGELSYWLVPEARGHGLASAAVRLMMASVVAGSGLRSVVLDIEAGNEASQRLAERLGAERRASTRVGGRPDGRCANPGGLCPAGRAGLTSGWRVGSARVWHRNVAVSVGLLPHHCALGPTPDREGQQGVRGSRDPRRPAPDPRPAAANSCSLPPSCRRRQHGVGQSRAGDRKEGARHGSRPN
ncbi:MAG: GNAT family N-acetyltransferase [Solirubrobacteraceae bacterium]